MTTVTPYLEGSQEKHRVNPATYNLKHSLSDYFEIDSTACKNTEKTPRIVTDGKYDALASPFLQSLGLPSVKDLIRKETG